MLISICIIVSCTNRTKQSVADVSVTRQQLIDYEKINDIIEDANGYIWFATSGGVFQYNGEIFYQYRSTVDTTSLCNDAALQFYLSKKGQLYVLTELTLQAFVTMLPCSSIFQRKGNFMFLPSLAHPCITMTGVFAQSLKRVNIHTHTILMRRVMDVCSSAWLTMVHLSMNIILTRY